jgi:N-acetylglutamate synthase-like GNAT family acetyltransferase
MKIRLAKHSDASAIAELAGQLGYPTSTEQAIGRLNILLASVDDVIFVVEEEEMQVVGWVHVHARPSLIDAPFAEIGALIVDDTHRSAGLGRLLVAEAETWAKGRGLASLWVRSNILRDRAHHFYEQLGFRRLKTQHVLVKDLYRQYA